MKARWYEPELGRFLSPDPVQYQPGNPTSFNRYAYANNSPYSFTDPDGEMAQYAASAACGPAAIACAIGISLVSYVIYDSVKGLSNSNTEQSNENNAGSSYLNNKALSGADTQGTPPGGGDDPNNGKFNNTKPWDYKQGVARHELVNKNGTYYVNHGGNLTRAKGNYDFVSINGRTYVGTPHAGHANIARGRPVDYAGQLHFGRGSTTRGILKSWNNQSGHYLPTAARAHQAGFSLQRFTTNVLF